MAGLNKLLIIGNVGNDPEMRYTPSGTPVTTFRIAVSRRFTSQGERREETEWFRVSAWNRLAEVVNQYVTKGSRLYVEGRLSSSTWTGQDGQPRFTMEIFATDVQLLDSRGAGTSGFGEEQGGGREAGGREPGGRGPVPEMDAEDLPF